MTAREWPIVVRFIVNEEDRRAIAAMQGDTGMATLAACRSFLTRAAHVDLNLAVEDYQDAEAER